MVSKEITGILLAGGKSSRMGEDKSLMEYEGKKMIQHVIDLIRPFVKEVIVVANDPEKYSFLNDVKLEQDYILNKGPLIGMISGLEKIATKWAFVTSCDMPFLNGNVIEYLWLKRRSSLGVVPFGNGYFEPLLGLYNKEIILRGKEYFNEYNGSLNGFLKLLFNEGLVEKVDRDKLICSFGKNLFINVNDKKIYDAIKKGDFNG